MLPLLALRRDPGRRICVVEVYVACDEEVVSEGVAEEERVAVSSGYVGGGRGGRGGKVEEEVEVEAPCDVKEESTGFSDEDD